MFEIRTALSYLIPHKKQLSASLIGIIACGVIAAIVWLILVFFSTTEGIEQGWSSKITSLLGSIQIIPTESYTKSPLYQMDFYSHKANREPSRLSQKALFPDGSYDKTIDSPLPKFINDWYEKTPSPKNSLYRITKILEKNHLPFRFFESTVAHLVLADMKNTPGTTISLYTVLLGYQTLPLQTFICVQEITPTELETALSLVRQKKLDPSLSFFSSINSFECITTIDLKTTTNDILPKGTFCRAKWCLQKSCSICLTATSGQEVFYEIASDEPFNTLPFSITKIALSAAPIILPKDQRLRYHSHLGYPVFLPKQMRMQNARLFDTGYFETPSQSPLSNTPTRFPFFIAGFFDSGVLSIGGKICITPLSLVVAIEPSLSSQCPLPPSGICLDIPLDEVDSITKKLQHAVQTESEGLFTVQPYTEFDITKDLYQQLASEKTIFQLISWIIICVACSNIFSMLFILAHDRRKEIAILRALGTSKTRIISIFTLSGIIIGLSGAFLGSFLASITLHNLPIILQFISSIQGQELLSQTIYGHIGPQNISTHTLFFTYISIMGISGFSGFLAALRACSMNISEALKS